MKTAKDLRAEFEAQSGQPAITNKVINPDYLSYIEEKLLALPNKPVHQSLGSGPSNRNR